ncbi:uncharacterized protein LOC143852026 [Tasmannia lanceolata]|uniref:uncharacterized protein LOC143852026 n=1 Tax=Tasmannia lanceolata TaxID=3420 RepID=UPI0040635DD5
MENAKKNSSSNMSVKPSAIPKPSFSDSYQRISSKEVHSHGIKENDQQFPKQNGPKFQNPKKGSKNFMASTISATSKAAPCPKKKILVERNEASGSPFSETQIEKNPKIGMEDSISDSFIGSFQITPLSSKRSESGNQSVVSPNSSSLPYDPLTNYLSPRPQYLRFNPNRRLEVILRRKSEDGLGLGLDKSSSPEPQKSMEDAMSSEAYTSSSQEESEKQEGGSSLCIDGLDSEPSNNQESELSEEGEEDDVEEEDEEEERNWYSNLLLKFLFLLGVLYFVLVFAPSTNPSAISPPLPAPLYRTTKMSMGRISERIRGFSESRSTFVGNISSTYPPQLVPLGEKVPSTYPSNGEETERNLLFLDDLTERGESEEKHSHDTVPFVSSEVEEEIVIGTDNDMLVGNSIREWGEFVADGESTEVVSCSNFSEQEQAKEHDLMEPTGKAINEEVGKDVVENETVKTKEITDQKSETSVFSEFSQVPPSQFDHKKSDVASTSEEEVNEAKERVSFLESIKEKLISKVDIALATLLVLAASMILAILGFKRSEAPVNSSPTFQEPVSESMVVEKSNSTFSMKEDIPKKGNSNLNTSLVHSDSNYGELYRARRPTVELLGELDVGEISITEKSSSLKSKKVEAEEISSSLKSKKVEAEEISFSQSHETKRSRGKSLSFSNHADPSVLEFSTAESPSYGSFTTQKKHTRKEEDGDGMEVTKVVTTPVRRSSRIRSRVMSP